MDQWGPQRSLWEIQGRSLSYDLHWKINKDVGCRKKNEENDEIWVETKDWFRWCKLTLAIWRNPEEYIHGVPVFLETSSVSSPSLPASSRLKLLYFSSFKFCIVFCIKYGVIVRQGRSGKILEENVRQVHVKSFVTGYKCESLDHLSRLPWPSLTFSKQM